MYLVPDEGIEIFNGKKIVFASFDDLLPSENDGIIDAEEFLKNYAPLLDDENEILSADSLENDTLQAESEEALKPKFVLIDGEYVLNPELEDFKARMSIQSGPQGIKNLARFFERARLCNEEQFKLRVLHYGDSQIETDRITRYLRNELQKRFGGVGPGLIPPVEIIPTGAVRQSSSSNWKRYTIFGKPDTTITHTRFAPLGSFASYDSTSAELTFAPSKMAYGRAAQYQLVELHLANYNTEATVEVYKSDSLVTSEVIPNDSTQKTLQFELNHELGELRFVFQGGPVECYAVGLEGAFGIQVDNIPMRGSSGTIFRKMDRQHLQQKLTEDEVGLVLLQYGGNSVPYVKDTVAAENYGRWMRSQIRLLQELLPNAAFILIGPSDMAYKEKDAFVTYPFLEPVRDNLKAAAFETGCGYWDIYEVMGGKNSMAAWVNADPPLAGTDYVHFTPKGARRVAELLVKALYDAEKNEDELQ